MLGVGSAVACTRGLQFQKNLSGVVVNRSLAESCSPLESWTLGPVGLLQHKPLPSRASRSPDGSELARSEEEVDELSLIDHSEIMARLTLKQEVSTGRVRRCPCRGGGL